MKKKLLISIIASGLLLMSLILYFAPKIYESVARYDTPNEAFSKSWGMSKKQIIHTYTEEPIALVLNKEGPTYSYEVLEKDKKGWKVVPHSTGFSIFSKLIDDIYIEVRRIADRYVVIITEFTKDSSIETVKDSENTTFYCYTNPNNDNRTWITVFEKEPSNYIIELGNRRITVN